MTKKEQHMLLLRNQYQREGAERMIEDTHFFIQQLVRQDLLGFYAELYDNLHWLRQISLRYWSKRLKKTVIGEEDFQADGATADALLTEVLAIDDAIAVFEATLPTIEE